MITPVDASYLADAVVLLRYFESGGTIRQAISVVKNARRRTQRTIREFRMENGRISVGQRAERIPRHLDRSSHSGCDA